MLLRNGSYRDLAEKIKLEKNRIVVYGAGMIGKTIIPYIIQAYHLSEYLDCFIDSDYRKKGSMVEICGKAFYVNSPDYLQSINDNTIILITNSKFQAIVDYLDDIDCLNNTEAYIIPMMQLVELDNTEPITINRLNGDARIPKKIHYCWFGGGRLSDTLIRCIESWKKYCPDYEIIEWNEHNYNVNRHDYTREAYEQGKYGFVTDLARFDILYEFGGLYFDTDVEMLQNIDDLLYCNGFIGVEKWGNINSGGGCGFISGHPMLKRIIDYRDGFHFVLPDGTLNIETNGMYETKPFLDDGFCPNNKMQIISDVVVFPSYVNHPYDYMSCKCVKNSSTISVHYFSGGWMDENDRKNREKTQLQYEKIEKRMIL